MMHVLVIAAVFGLVGAATSGLDGCLLGLLTGTICGLAVSARLRYLLQRRAGDCTVPRVSWFILIGVTYLLLVFGIGRATREEFTPFYFLGGLSCTGFVVTVSTVFAMIWWTIAIRRAKLYPHCPACGYSFEGLRSEVCPECGTVRDPADDES